MTTFLRISALPGASLADAPECESMEPVSTECKNVLIWVSFLDQADQKDLETRLDAIHGVYKALTTREVQFEFKQDYTFYQLKQRKAAKAQ